MAPTYRPYALSQIIDEAADIRTFVFRPSDGQPVLPYVPGQFFLLRNPHLPPEAKPNFHSYSCARVYRPNSISFGIKKHGLFTQAMFQLKIGDAVDLSGPFGLFTLPAKIDFPVVFLAGGIGITPLLCMAEHLSRTGHDRPFFLFYSNRNLEDIAYDGLLHQLTDLNPRFKLVRTLTCADMPDNWTGERGRLNTEMLVRNGVNVAAAHFYFCGPKPFIDAMLAQLSAAGVPKERLHKEAW